MKKLLAFSILGLFSLASQGMFIAQWAIVQAMDYREELDLARSELRDQWMELKVDYLEFKNTLTEEERATVNSLKWEFMADRNIVVEAFRAIENKTIEDLEVLYQDIRSLKDWFIDDVKSVLEWDKLVQFLEWAPRWMAHYDARFELRVDFHETKKAFKLEKYSRRAQEIAIKIEGKLAEVERKVPAEVVIPVYEKIFDKLQWKIAEFDSRGVSAATEPLVALLDLFAYKIELLKNGAADQINNIANDILNDLDVVDWE